MLRARNMTAREKYAVRARIMLCAREICRASEKHVVRAKYMLCAREDVIFCAREYSLVRKQKRHYISKEDIV